jgi:hypothetical protein
MPPSYYTPRTVATHEPSSNVARRQRLSARIWGFVALLSGQLVALIEIVRKLS